MLFHRRVSISFGIKKCNSSIIMIGQWIASFINRLSSSCSVFIGGSSLPSYHGIEYLISWQTQRKSINNLYNVWSCDCHVIIMQRTCDATEWGSWTLSSSRSLSLQSESPVSHWPLYVIIIFNRAVSNEGIKPFFSTDYRIDRHKKCALIRV